MLETLFETRFTRARHLSAPLLIERERYLSHLLYQGSNALRVRQVAAMLLNVVEVVAINELRLVTRAEIHDAGKSWAARLESKFKRPASCERAVFFYQTANGFFRFHDSLEREIPRSDAFGLVLPTYRQYLSDNRAASTVGPYFMWARQFLESIEGTHLSLSTIAVSDIEAFINAKRASGIKPSSISFACAALKTFLKFTESQGWTKGKLASAIRRPPTTKYDSTRVGPAWSHVRALLKTGGTHRNSDIRARAILHLLALYALRSSELSRLLLADFDWIGKTITVRRSKNGLVQVFPLRPDGEEVVLLYIQKARPICSSRCLFVTIAAPHRQMVVASIGNLVRDRMKSIEGAAHTTPHNFRHACATRLLAKGSSLAEIADFLGHRGLDTVSTYLRCSPQALRLVSEVSLGLAL